MGAGIEPIDTGPGDRQTAELAEKLRLLAQTDPVLARALVAEMVTAVNVATGGAFGRHLSPAARDALGVTDDAPLDGLEAAWSAATGAADATAAAAAGTRAAGTTAAGAGGATAAQAGGAGAGGARAPAPAGT